MPDINLLVYAYNIGAPEHAKAKLWWEKTVNGDRPVGMPWAVSAGFVRLATHPGVLTIPYPPHRRLTI